jgi:hypothetical protein
MGTPNPELMHVYGTDAYYLEKVGAFKDVLQMAAPAAWMGLLAHNHAEEERHRAEAEALNLAMRQAEAERMRPTLQGFYGHDVPRPPAQEDLSDPFIAINALEGSLKVSSAFDLTKFAEGLGRSLARREMAKAAAGGMMEHQFRVNAQGAPAAPAAPAPRPPAGGPYRTAGVVPPSVPPVASAPPAPIPTPAAATATGPITSIKDPRFQAAPGHIAGEGLSDFATSPWAKDAPKLQARAAKAGVVPTFTPTAGAPHPPVPTAGLRPPKVSKPWISTSTKLKGLGVLGIGALAYGGYKLMNKAKQKMEEPHHGGHTWGRENRPLFTGVGEYSHPVYA